MYNNNNTNTSNMDGMASGSMNQQQQQQQQMANANQQQQPQQQQPPRQSAQRSASGASVRSQARNRAYVEITEQPAPKALRFRYECEGRSAGSIPGIRSTPENKTYPSIRVCGHRGDAFVVVSCVTKDQPYKPHPHNLVGKDCKTGVCTVKITEESMSITFNNLGIQCVKKKDIEDALKKREEIKVDPFKTGFSHRNQPSSIDLNAVRLCFQVFVSTPNNGLVAIQPVVSEPIFDKKAMSELVICKMSDCSSSVAGGRDIILLCEKVVKEDIAVRFYEEQDGTTVWEANGEFQHNNVHKQVAISFRTPAYRYLQVDNVVKVFVQLKRPSDGATSDPIPFDYLPLDSVRMHKRPKIENREILYRRIQDHEQQQQQQQQQQKQSDLRQTIQQKQQQPQQSGPGLGYLNIKVDPIKQEPRDQSPANFNLFGGYRVNQGTPSPQPPSPQTMFTQQMTNAGATLFHSPPVVQQQQQQPQLNNNNNNPSPDQFGGGGGGGGATNNHHQFGGGGGQNLMNDNQNVFGGNFMRTNQMQQQQQQQHLLQQSQSLQQNNNNFLNFLQMTSSFGNGNNNNNNTQSQHQWNINPNPMMKQMNDLSTTTTTTGNNNNNATAISPPSAFLPHQVAHLIGQAQMLQGAASTSAAGNNNNNNSMGNYMIDLVADGSGGGNDLTQLNTGDLLPNEHHQQQQQHHPQQVPDNVSRMDQDQDNMTDSLTRLRLEVINDLETQYQGQTNNNNNNIS